MLASRVIIVPAIVLACLHAGRTAEAQTTLRWQLQPTEKLALEVTQQTTSDVAYSGKRTTTQIDLTMELGWEVLTAQAGRIRIKQTLSRVAVLMESPSAGRVEYDSAKPGRPSGLTRDVAAAVTPLLAAALEITMNERGEVLEAKPASLAAQQLMNPADDPTKPPLLPKESIQQLLRQPLAVLPDKPVQTGDTWTTKAELKSALGAARQTTTYRYVGLQEQDGDKLDKIDVSSELQLDTDAARSSKLTLKEHEQTGTIYFSSAAGRLVSAEQTQKLVTERPYRETTIVVTLTSKQQTVVKPADKN